MPRLKLVVDAIAIREYELADEPVFIGRHPSNAVVLDDSTVSGRHAAILPEPSPYLEDSLQYFIEDLDSTNGTLLNGLELKRKTLLANGDRIQIGRQQLQFVDESATEPDRTDILLPEDTSG